GPPGGRSRGVSATPFGLLVIALVLARLALRPVLLGRGRSRKLLPPVTHALRIAGESAKDLRPRVGQSPLVGLARAGLVADRDFQRLELFQGAPDGRGRELRLPRDGARREAVAFLGDGVLDEGPDDPPADQREAIERHPQDEP